MLAPTHPRPDRGHFWSWTVYDHPTDFPTGFVARLFDWDQPTHTAIFHADLEHLRSELRNLGLKRVNRRDDDDPAILETWL